MVVPFSVVIRPLYSCSWRSTFSVHLPLFPHSSDVPFEILSAYLVASIRLPATELSSYSPRCPLPTCLLTRRLSWYTPPASQTLPPPSAYFHRLTVRLSSLLLCLDTICLDHKLTSLSIQLHLPFSLQRHPVLSFPPTPDSSGWQDNKIILLNFESCYWVLSLFWLTPRDSYLLTLCVTSSAKLLLSYRNNTSTHWWRPLKVPTTPSSLLHFNFLHVCQLIYISFCCLSVTILSQ